MNLGQYNTRHVIKHVSLKFNWYILDFFDIFQKCYFCILHTFLNMCVKFQGNLISFLGKINKIKSYYDFRINAFLAKINFLHKIVCLCPKNSKFLV